MDKLVEVRISTYKRPDWLKEAIASLINQDYIFWKAIVFDDSPDQEAKSVVASLQDDRFIYRPNATNLGASDNLNQCFDTTPYVGGEFAFVLEDDNWLYPDFISSNLQAMEMYNVNIIHRNQDVWSRESEVPVKGRHTTLRNRYTRQIMTPMQLHANAFFFPGVSNGALFFRTKIPSQLSVSIPVKDPSLQEYLRCLAIVDDSVYLDEPKAAFAYVPLSNTHRHYSSHFLFSAVVQRIYLKLFERYGNQLTKEVLLIAAALGKERMAYIALANVNKLWMKYYQSHPSYLKFMVSGLVKRVLYAGLTSRLFKTCLMLIVINYLLF